MPVQRPIRAVAIWQSGLEVGITESTADWVRISGEPLSLPEATLEEVQGFFGAIENNAELRLDRVEELPQRLLIGAGPDPYVLALADPDDVRSDLFDLASTIDRQRAEWHRT